VSTSLAELRAYYAGSPMRGLLLEGLVGEPTAAAMRERVRPLLQSFYIADRGRYRVDATHDEPEVVSGMTELASAIVEKRLTPGRRRWTRLAHGDYAMYKGDVLVWDGLDRHMEMVLDFSATQTGEGQVGWSDGDQILWMPQVPLCGALVDRRRKIMRYDRYVTHRAGTAEIFRLSLALEVP
jgi:hypothetical protein